MNFTERLDEIVEAKNNDRLVIFVGAGISRNSGLPDWGELIKEFAPSINYEKCIECNCENENNCNIVSNDDYLKIPQYYYNQYGKEEYYQKIVDKIAGEYKPNDINDIIIKLNPSHIITTNYDKLIESTNHPNVLLYEVIYEDKDLLEKISKKYIIKMHGDINNIDSIVLKEDDYLHYAQKHRLIEAKLKSLLLDHTFLFVGYSLNDYNLKLIIKWIEEVANGYDLPKRKCKNYIIDYREYQNYEIEYFERNNTFIIDKNDIDKNFIKTYSEKCGLEGDIPKAIYSVLNAVYTQDYFYNDVNSDNLYKVFNNIDEKYYSNDILKEFQRFIKNGFVEFLENTLVFSHISYYEKFVEVFTSNDEKIQSITNKLVLLGIHNLKHENKYYKLNFTVFEQDEFLILSQNNKFNTIIEKINTEKESLKKLYYINLCNIKDVNIKDLVNIISSELIISKDFINSSLLLLNKILIAKQQKYFLDEYESKDIKALLDELDFKKYPQLKFLSNIYYDRIDYKVYEDKLLRLEKNYKKENVHYIMWVVV